LNARGTAVANIILLAGHTAPINRAFFSPDGSMVISASDDGTVRLWSINDVRIPEEFDKLLDVARKRLPVTMSNADRDAIRAQAGETP
jgi:WD40 repeat protein